ncbi:HAD family phosphatase [Seleniivibrio sp.]|uniref:HAD family hydrolase n=1 Tax=Seleniivibrio sp. TaxID=2898801 RepID=UPI0025F1B520|nr:HAD family phosphatase [Seleniivibrio sp.]MCD8554048.1 HAD family phosphatase [Seleniivibrio sp.]
MFKAALLDFDNTILGTEQGNFKAFHDAMHDIYGHGLRVEDFMYFSGSSWLDIFRYITGKYGKVTPEYLNQSFIDKKADFFKKHGVVIADGFKELMERPILRAIVTGSSRAEIEIFSDVIDFSAFDTIVTNDDIVNGKPHPEPYLLAQKRLNIAATECFAVEDSRMGITSARAAGVFTYFLRQFADEDHTSIADRAVYSMREIIF